MFSTQTDRIPSPEVKVLVCGTADWDQAIATNQHYMVRELATEFSVIYTESIGLRRPTFRAQDLSRIWRRVLSHSNDRAERAIPKAAEVRSPRTIPFHHRPTRRINTAIYENLVADYLSYRGPKLLWTYTPLVYLGDVANHRLVYHCVDLLHTIDGIPRHLILENEHRLARSGAIAIASSVPVREHLVDIGFTQTLLWNNVADTEPILSSAPREGRPRAKKVVFAGNLTPGKIDFAILAEVARSGLELHLAGPTDEWSKNGRSQLAELVDAGAKYHGLLSYQELAELYWDCSVGLIPYRNNSYTHGVNPLKMYEYLAAGMAVVSTSLPSVIPRPGDVEVADSPHEFTKLVGALAATGGDEVIFRRQEIASAHSWLRRGTEARELVASLV